MGPLQGLKIIEVAGIGPAPFAAMMLSDMGADVIRVDRSANAMGGDPDTRRRTSSTVAAARSRSISSRPTASRPCSTWSSTPTRSIEGFRPGVAERLGFGPEVCAERNPRLVFGRMTGWGQDGPVRLDRRPRHQLHRPGRRAGAPGPRGREADAADQPGRRLRRRRHAAGVRRGVRAAGGPGSGQGQVVDAAMVDGSASLMTMMWALQGTWASGATSAARTCWTPPRTSTTPTSAPMVGSSRSARSSRSSTRSCSNTPGSRRRYEERARSCPTRWTAHVGPR